MKCLYGVCIKELKVMQNLYMYLVPLIKMDIAKLNKIEKRLPQFKQEQIPIPTIAEILKANCDELMMLWLTDQIYEVVKDEKLANETMQVAEQKLNFIKRNKK